MTDHPQTFLPGFTSALARASCRRSACYPRRVRSPVPRSSSMSVVALLLAALALLAAGCGGDPRANYQRGLGEVGAKVAAALDEFPRDEQQAVSPRQIHGLADQLREASDDLDGLDAPDDATGRAQEQLVDGLSGVAKAFDDLADDLDDDLDDDARAELFVSFASDTRIDRAFTDISEAQAKFATAGFQVFGKGGAPAAVATTK